MNDDLRPLRLVAGLDVVECLRQDLPAAWRGPVIGPDIPGWHTAPGAHLDTINLNGLPETIRTELAWMAHWQEVVDGTPASVQSINQFALVLRRAMRENRPFPGSIREMSWETAEALLGWFYATRWKKLLPEHCRGRLRAVFRLARLALIARCHEGHWWELDDWYPRCDRRIPISGREPHNCRVTPGRIIHPWLRAAVKWHLGTSLEAGTLRWSTISQARLLTRFDRWLAVAFDDGRDVLGDPAAAAVHAAAFRRWVADPANRSDRPQDRRSTVHPRLVNGDLQAVAELFGFVAANSVEARAVLGPSPWQQVTEAHAASWLHQASLRTPRQHDLNDEHYVDDHALAQITAALPLIGLPRGQQMTLARGDGTHVKTEGFGDPQAMRMILLQILTGRRASEVRICEFDCLSPPEGPADADGQEVTRFRYAQSKIDIAPDTILVDKEIAAVIEEQQHWVRDQFPGIEPRFLFTQRISNLVAAKPYSSGTYGRALRNFSDIVRIRDSKGRPVRLSHTHRFRHTKLTRLAELGLPIRVLQRYAGHATPTMSMHYIAKREEHAEQAFVATTKFKADGTRVMFSRENHDSLHLFDRADRFLPHGWCLLPPLQTCDKGNACLTCSVFVTDETHHASLERQLAETTALITRTTDAFHQRHGRPMPADNVWLAQRHAERSALTQLLAKMHDNPGRAVQGGGCGAAAPSPGPVPITIDLSRHRRTQP